MPQLAEYNIAKLRHPLDAAETAEFVASLAPINAIAESSPGFVWRLKDDDGGSSSFVEVEAIGDPLVIINMSIWEDLASLQHFVVKSGHGSYLRRRSEWFERLDGPTTVCWWIPDNHRPTADEAHGRLLELQTNGPSDQGWPMNKPHPAPKPLK